MCTPGCCCPVQCEWRSQRHGSVSSGQSLHRCAICAARATWREHGRVLRRAHIRSGIYLPKHRPVRCCRWSKPTSISLRLPMFSVKYIWFRADGVVHYGFALYVVDSIDQFVLRFSRISGVMRFSSISLRSESPYTSSVMKYPSEGKHFLEVVYHHDIGVCEAVAYVKLFSSIWAILFLRCVIPASLRVLSITHRPYSLQYIQDSIPPPIRGAV